MASTVRPRVRAVGLMERDGVLAALRGALAEVRAGSGRMVLLSGEAGIGKTAIVEAFTGEAGAPVLLGGCDPIEAPRPLGPFLDALATSAGEPPGTVQATFAALRTAAGGSRAVLVLEDMHWADEASLDVLRLTGRRLESLALLVVATYREDGLGRDHQLRVVLGDIASAREVSRIRLEPLTQSGVAELCRGRDRDPAAVHRLTGGNPFFVSELLDAGGDALPETVSDAVLARAARLDRESKQMLELISISPLPLNLSLLERVATGLAGLDGCLTSGLLDEHAGVVRFRHELARMAVERSLPAARRRDLHALLLSGLAGADDPERLAILAHHAEGAGDAAAVLRYASAAATQAGRRGAHREEARQYARALRHADGLPAADRARLHLLHADALYATDLQAESIDAGLRAASCAEQAGAVATQAEAIARLAPRYLCRGETEQAGRAAARAQELLAHDGDSLQLATLYSVMAQIALCRDDFAGTVEWATRAAAMARRFGDEEVALGAEVSAGTAEGLRTGRAGSLEQALARARSVGSSAAIPRALNNLALVAVLHRRHEPAARWIREGLAHCADHDLDLWWLSIRWLEARSLLDRGEWSAAAELAAQLVADPRDSPEPRFQGLLVQAQVRARRGDPGVQEALTAAAEYPTGEVSWIGPLACARAEAAYLQGHPDRIDALTARDLDRARAAGLGWLAGELACWRSRAGAGGHGDPDGLAEPYRLELAGHHHEAAAAWDALGSPYEAGLALSTSAQETDLAEAHARLSALGARPAAALVARRLRELGVRGVARGPRPATRANPANLTVRETEVLALLAEGLTNGEIAGRLFVSRRTVDHHVAAILRKLEAPSRSRAVVAAGRLGITEPAAGSR